MRKILITLMALIAAIPTLSFAEENNLQFEVVSFEVKYFKTTTIYGNNLETINILSANLPTSYTEEISKDEYDSYSVDEELSTNVSSYISTEYKKMTTSILSNGSYYRYKVVLDWKKMPKVRSYDIIGIGHTSKVKIKGTPVFNLKYCTDPSTCTTITSALKQSFDLGAGASFVLPAGSFTTLQATYYYDVEKNGNSTLYSQTAYGDYSHATSSVSSTQSKKYLVNNSGIVLDASISNYYDSINSATVSWTGTW